MMPDEYGIDALKHIHNEVWRGSHQLSTINKRSGHQTEKEGLHNVTEPS